MKSSAKTEPVISRLLSPVAIAAVALAGSCCSGNPSSAPEGGNPVSFSRDIKPLLGANCVLCHNGETLLGGLNLETREKAFQQSGRGAIITPGDAGSSLLYTMTAQRHGSSGDAAPEIMPADGILLSESERDLLKRWIDEGADWPGDAEGTIEVIKLTPGA